MVVMVANLVIFHPQGSRDVISQMENSNTQIISTFTVLTCCKFSSVFCVCSWTCRTRSSRWLWCSPRCTACWSSPSRSSPGSGRLTPRSSRSWSSLLVWRRRSSSCWHGPSEKFRSKVWKFEKVWPCQRDSCVRWLCARRRGGGGAGGGGGGGDPCGGVWCGWEPSLQLQLSIKMQQSEWGGGRQQDVLYHRHHHKVQTLLSNTLSNHFSWDLLFLNYIIPFVPVPASWWYLQCGRGSIILSQTGPHLPFRLQ